ncbi:hypothetical protein Q5P01_008432 [Channa striata]|uniref:Uncharacterized protein n=1 Tax=Channa striata TaxID=64152 RepID=A0AA88SU21_CHASR|nr:hypothetical protein Q5P01_008432 [Channa striata]
MMPTSSSPTFSPTSGAIQLGTPTSSPTLGGAQLSVCCSAPFSQGVLLPAPLSKLTRRSQSSHRPLVHGPWRAFVADLQPHLHMCPAFATSLQLHLQMFLRDFTLGDSWTQTMRQTILFLQDSLPWVISPYPWTCPTSLVHTIS